MRSSSGCTANWSRSTCLRCGCPSAARQYTRFHFLRIRGVFRRTRARVRGARRALRENSLRQPQRRGVSSARLHPLGVAPCITTRRARVAKLYAASELAHEAKEPSGNYRSDDVATWRARSSRQTSDALCGGLRRGPASVRLGSSDRQPHNTPKPPRKRGSSSRGRERSAASRESRRAHRLPLPRGGLPPIPAAGQVRAGSVLHICRENAHRAHVKGWAACGRRRGSRCRVTPIRATADGSCWSSVWRTGCPVTRPPATAGLCRRSWRWPGGARRG